MRETPVIHKYHKESSGGPTPADTRKAIIFANLIGAHVIVQETLKKVYAPVDPNSYLGYVLINGGDYFNGYAAAWGAKTFMDRQGYNISEKWKYAISTAVGAGTITVAETLKLPVPLMGTPDVYDIPAGLLGVACYLGVSLWANKYKNSSKNIAQQNL